MAGRVHAARVVLVHGSRLSGAQWAPQLPRLARYVDAVTADLPVRTGRLSW